MAARKPPKRKWTAAEVVHALRVAYGVADSQLVTDEWSFLTEVPLRSGTGGKWSANERTIDIMLTRNWSAGVGHRRIAIEVKISRSDFRNETDLKRLPAEQSAHQCYYAAPAGLLTPKDLPKGWGLIEVYPDTEAYEEGTGWPLGHFTLHPRVRTRVRAVEAHPSCDLDYLVSAAMRRGSRAEERIRRGEDDAAAVPALRVEVESLHQKLARREQALDREKNRTALLLSQYLAAVGEQMCADCGKAIGYQTRTAQWKHREVDDQIACLAAREEADRKRREETVGARYFRGYATPIEPKSLREQAVDLDAVPDDYR